MSCSIHALSLLHLGSPSNLISPLRIHSPFASLRKGGGCPLLHQALATAASFHSHASRPRMYNTPFRIVQDLHRADRVPPLSAQVRRVGNTEVGGL